MKSIALIACLILLSSSSQGQFTPTPFPLAISYFSPFAINPGVKIGTEWQFQSWEKTKAQKDFSRQYSLSLQPQIAYFKQIGHRDNFLLNVDLAFRRQKKERRSYSALGIGLGYVNQLQTLSWSINLSDGRRENKVQTRHHFFTPNINYEWGWFISNRLNSYAKFSYAPWFSATAEDNNVLYVELGLKWHWSNPKN